MKVEEIKEQLLQGEQFENPAADWFTICKPSGNLFWIVIRGKDYFYKNIDSAARRIFKLMNTGE